MLRLSTEREFVVEIRLLPESIVAVLIYPRLFLNEQHVGKQNEVMVWAKKMVAIGKSHEIMWMLRKGKFSWRRI